MNVYNLSTLFNFIGNILSDHYFLTLLFSISFALKIFLLVPLIRKKVISQLHYPALFLAGALVCLVINDLDWILGVFVKKYFLNDIDLPIFIFLRRLAWGCLVFQYQLSGLFLETLCESQFALRIRHYLTLTASLCFFSFFLIMSITNIGCIRAADKPHVEFLVEKIEFIYALIVFAVSFCVVAKLLYKRELPRLLVRQLKFILLVMIPYWLSDFLSLLDFDLYWPGFSNTHSILVSINTAILTFAGFYCARKIIGLRFLNFKSHVVTPVRLDFVDHFKGILEQFSHVTHVHELKHITQRFFKDAFNISIGRCLFYIRNSLHGGEVADEHRQHIVKAVEHFIGTHHAGVGEFIRNHKILIYDEIAFNNFYEPSDTSKTILEFLDYINADIFLPVYQKDKLIAYIIIDRFARGQEFYSRAEHDEMLVFTSYLANIINLLQNKEIDALMHQEKQLQEELYRKHQEVNQYKESIRSFLRSTKERAIGVLFYKNRQFAFANQAAKELIGFDPNVKEGHALTRLLKSMVQKVEAYKAAQQVYTKDAQGETLVISGVPNLEMNNIIIMVYYPEVADLIKNQIDMLKDPSEWDYLLYLQTTRPGKLINQLIPGMGEKILNFKIELLKVALGKKATVLNLPDEDLAAVAELVHAISLRETLQVIDLAAPITNYDMAINLFGVDTLFDTHAREPLLKKLDEVGTLYIKNIHFLDFESQKYLAEFIRYGYFRMFKSDKKITSNVRIICSTNCDLAALVREGKFTQVLFDELKNSTISMPSLMMLPEKELSLLAEGFSEQAVGAAEFTTLLSLTEKDKRILTRSRPASLKELRLRVQQLLQEKSKKSQISCIVSDNPLAADDPELLEISRLGKHVLKDRHLFTQLWHKVKNQNKVATLLGVNRSSVNRRCKAYNLH